MPYLDTRIPLGVQPVQVEDPLEYEKQRLTLESLAQQRQLRKAQIKEQELQNTQRQRALDDEQAYRTARTGGKTARELLGTHTKFAAAELKAEAELRKSELDASEKELKNQAAKIEQASSLAGSVKDDNSLVVAVGKGLTSNLIDRTEAAKLLAQGFQHPETQAYLKQAQMQALKAKDQITLAFDALKEERARLEHEAKLPGMKAESQAKQLGAAAQTVTSVTNQEEYSAWRDGLPGEVKNRVPAKFSPAAVQMVQRMGMTSAQQAADTRQAAAQSETARHNRQSEANTIRGQNLSAETTRRGQDMADRRAAEKPPTEAQSNAAGFANRIEAANKIFDEIEPEISGMASNMKGAQMYFERRKPNSFKSPVVQRQEQAERDFVNAILRKESGAAISQSEFDNAKEQYFPQSGDTERVLKQKKEARARALSNMRQAAGRFAAASSSDGTIRVRRKVDGKTGTMKASDFDASKYEKL